MASITRIAVLLVKAKRSRTYERSPKNRWASKKMIVTGRSERRELLHAALTSNRFATESTHGWLTPGLGLSFGTPGQSRAARCRSHRLTSCFEMYGLMGSSLSQGSSSPGVGADTPGSATTAARGLCGFSPGCGSV